MSDKEMWEVVLFFAGMALVVVLSMALACFVTYKLRDVQDRVRCNVAVVFGTPIVLFFLCRLSFVVTLLLPMIVFGLFSGGVTILFAWPKWKEKQIGLSFMLSGAAVYALLVVAYRGAS